LEASGISPARERTVLTAENDPYETKAPPESDRKVEETGHHHIAALLQTQDPKRSDDCFESGRSTYRV